MVFIHLRAVIRYTVLSIDRLVSRSCFIFTSTIFVQPRKLVELIITRRSLRHFMLASPSANTIGRVRLR